MERVWRELAPSPCLSASNAEPVNFPLRKARARRHCASSRFDEVARRPAGNDIGSMAAKNQSAEITLARNGIRNSPTRIGRATPRRAGHSLRVTRSATQSKKHPRYVALTTALSDRLADRYEIPFQAVYPAPPASSGLSKPAPAYAPGAVPAESGGRSTGFGHGTSIDVRAR